MRKKVPWKRRKPLLPAKMDCPHCGKEFSGKGLGSHIWRVHGAGIDFKPSAGHSAWCKGLTKATSDSLVKMIETRNRKIESGEIVIVGHEHTEETKKKLRLSALKRVNEGASHRFGHSKRHVYSNQSFDSGWEVSFAKWCDSHEIRWERCKNSFEYTWQDSIHLYMPDFWMPDAECFVEIKGMIRERDRAKWSGFPKNQSLIVLTQKELRRLKIV